MLAFCPTVSQNRKRAHLQAGLRDLQAWLIPRPILPPRAA
jgi:hypothetical protein